MPNLRQPSGQAVCQVNGDGHVHIGFVAGITEHKALVTGTQSLRHFAQLGLKGTVYAQSYVRGLVFDCSEHRACIGVKTEFGPGITDAAQGVPDDIRHLHVALGGYLSCHQHKPCLDEAFTGNPRNLVLLKDRIEDGIDNLVGYFIRVALSHRF